MTESVEKYIRQLEKEIKDLKEQNASQLSMYEMTAIYLKKLQEDLKVSEQRLLKANRDMTDSINYAKHIQDAFIVQNEVLQRIIPNSFVFQQPKSIVSGDFVWVFEDHETIYLAAGDCTGHGVPGAMLSIFVVSMLNQIMAHQNTYTPAHIIQQLDVLMEKYLNQYTDQLNDSVELVIVQLNAKKSRMVFAGAKRPLIQVRNGTFEVHKGTYYTLGNEDRRSFEVEDKTIEMREGDMFYMLSDGYTDQFGGERNSKFTTARTYQLFNEIAHLPIAEQLDKITETLKNWKQNYSQTDDILVVGFKI